MREQEQGPERTIYLAYALLSVEKLKRQKTSFICKKMFILLYPMGDRKNVDQNKFLTTMAFQKVKEWRKPQ